MRDLRGAVAVVTGAASGIGAGLAVALAREGARLVLADIASTATTEAEIRDVGGTCIAQHTDVADRVSLERLAEVAYATYGRVNLLCNNAGVVLFGPIAEITEQQWDWIFSINVMGVINGVAAFLPRMLDQDDERHVLNTASGAGLVASGAMPLGAYTTSKFAVVGFSDSLRLELAPHGIGVTTLYPGSVQTGILDSARYTATAEGLRPRESGGVTPSREGVRRMKPADVAALALAGVKAGQDHVFTHPESFAAVEERFTRLRSAADAARVQLSR